MIVDCEWDWRLRFFLLLDLGVFIGCEDRIFCVRRRLVLCVRSMFRAMVPSVRIRKDSRWIRLL